MNFPRQVIWVGVITCILICASLLTSPIKTFKLYVLRWLHSDLGAFMCVIIIAFLVVIAFTWLHIFAKLLLFIAAGTLVRLDIQVLAYQKWQAFTLLVGISGVGFGLGWLLYQGAGVLLIK